MNISTISAALEQLVANLNQPSELSLDASPSAGSFIYELLAAYGLPKASISRLKSGNLNLSKAPDEVIWKKKLHFKSVTTQAEGETDLLHVMDALKSDPAVRIHAPRFIITADANNLLAFDTKTNDPLSTELVNLAKHADFFLPWAGMEKAQATPENAADVKAAVKMAKLYDLIRTDNPACATTPADVHALNVFLSRLLFCFFAEDTGIFSERQFTTAIDSHTQKDGSDLAPYLDTVFGVMNTPHKDRAPNLPVYLTAFEYVNGGLFRDHHPAPAFSFKSRDLLIDLGSLDWAEINPDIFGSMIQAVVMPDQRGDLGMHYTSVPNIMKVIGPLFLDELEAEFENAQYEPRKLDALRERISRLKIFDPACGSGNFLITAYKKLCELEIKILQQRLELQKISLSERSDASEDGFAMPQGDLIPKAQRSLAQSFQLDLGSRIQLAQFYGIEIDDFAHEIAILSLWLAQHQMNVQFKSLFGSANPTLPLAPIGNIVRDNACRVDWEEVCPKRAGDEIYILGNPPYLGARLQSIDQKNDVRTVFADASESGNLDYIACWFFKGARHIRNSNSAFAFVTTNSICQGEQVALLWPQLLGSDLEIGFAHTSFKWVNNARFNAGVTVAIVSVRSINLKPKNLYLDNLQIQTENINAYLLPFRNIFIQKKSQPLSKLPMITFGNMANDGGNLILDFNQCSVLTQSDPIASNYIRKLAGSQEFINNEQRFCLWISDSQLLDALKVQEIARRIEACGLTRSKSKRKNTIELASLAHQFGEVRHKETDSIIVPRVSSESRAYVPIGFLNETTVISDSAFAIYDAQPYLFALLTSKLHMAWIKAVCGRLKTDIRYSSTLGYNTFPFPDITERQKAELEQSAFRILEAREQHSEKTLAQLYDPKHMPADLRAAHEQNDLAVERCYRSKLFTSDEERLAYLFTEYERMIAAESAQLDLLAAEKPVRKSKAKTKLEQKV